ncbi:class I adenylate-forming enzyme family protein [Kitasatospora mediocidica]|uniref:class I adenylate-forming enzyme family protein n=1 Tax=Kitasatospora mediocidica TaxID=58352 RepID=UPI00068D29A1|nr:fatty acid--CoA ligase family protein [Kitasatospora mediocidica]
MAVPDTWWTGHGGYAARIMSALVADPDRIAVHWREQPIPAGEFARSVTGTVRALRGLGVGPGSVLGILVAPNSPDMLRARYAAHLLGAAVCHLRSTNPGSTVPVLSLDEQLRILCDTRADVLFTDADNARRAQALVKGTPGRLALTGFDLPIAEAMPVTPADDPGPGGSARWDPPALAVIAFTSGSTGRPKGIRLPARAWESVVSATGASITESRQARILVTTPLSHTVGPMADAVLAAGGAVFLHGEADAGEILRAVQEHRITRTFLATPQLYKVLDHGRAATTDLSSLRQLIYSGCAAAPARIAEASRLLGPVLVQGYGTSEGGRISFLDPGDHQRPELLGTVGRPFPEVEIRVCDPDSERELAAGATGEVWVRSPHLMEGYWADPELTARVLRAGWYRTGDIGRLDERGYLHLLDRVADVVKTRGVKVYPAVLERELLAVDGVAQAAVYGVRDADNIEHLHAALVPRPGARIRVGEVRSRIRTALSPLHVPEEVVLLDELPLNDSGKPDKHRLRRERQDERPHPESELTQ